MSDNLLERLETLGRGLGRQFIIYNEAADEITRLRAENEKLLNANLSLRNKYLRLQHKLGRIAKVLDEPTVAAAAIRESGDEA